MLNYHQLYTPKDTAVVFIDFQPQMLFGVSGIDRAAFINNVTLLAKAAKEFNVPTFGGCVMTTTNKKFADLIMHNGKSPPSTRNIRSEKCRDQRWANHRRG